VFRRALNQALKWGAVTRNVAVLVDRPRVEKHTNIVLTPEQGQLLLSTAADIGWRRCISWRCCSGYAKARC
jgi:hypothetical protein